MNFSKKIFENLEKSLEKDGKGQLFEGSWSGSKGIDLGGVGEAEPLRCLRGGGAPDGHAALPQVPGGIQLAGGVRRSGARVAPLEAIELVSFFLSSLNSTFNSSFNF